MIELCQATEDNPFIQGMSKQFVQALEQLFDVMDTDSSGTIKYADLASQWEEDNSDPYFPKGLSTCLAKVTLPNGLLTFDRFCAGIKLCLVKNQVELKEVQDAEVILETKQQNSHNLNNNNNSSSTTGLMLTDYPQRPSSEPKIFAPPPPPFSSLGLSGRDLNNGELNNNNTSLGNKNNSSLHSSSSANASTSNSATLSEDSTKSKKLPLPSYEQVMAAKHKTVNKILTLERGITSSIGANANPPKLNGVEELASIGTLTKFSVVNHGKPEDAPRRMLNFYENFAALSNESTRYPSESFAQRAKSMSHLDSLTPNGLATFQFEPNGNLEAKLNSLENAFSSQSSEHPNGAELLKQSTSLSSSALTRCATQNNGGQPKTLSRNCILKTLQSWRDNILHKQVGDNPESPKNFTDVNAINHNKCAIDVSVKQNTANEMATNSLTVSSLKRNVPKRREPRRHTVGANGIDLYAIKRLQQLEQEKVILIRGLGEIDKTKEWYMRQIAGIQDKINFAGQSASFPSECNIDSYQERLNFQSARIQNLNQHLMALREANQNFPLHMNLAIRPFNGVPPLNPTDPNQPKQLVVNPNLVNKLKVQNRLLTEEVSRKSDKITQLEREKFSLIRELFQARTTYSPNYYTGDFDDTFM